MPSEIKTVQENKSNSTLSSDVAHLFLISQINNELKGHVHGFSRSESKMESKQLSEVSVTLNRHQFTYTHFLSVIYYFFYAELINENVEVKKIVEFFKTAFSPSIENLQLIFEAAESKYEEHIEWQKKIEQLAFTDAILNLNDLTQSIEEYKKYLQQLKRFSNEIYKIQLDEFNRFLDENIKSIDQEIIQNTESKRLLRKVKKNFILTKQKITGKSTIDYVDQVIVEHVVRRAITFCWNLLSATYKVIFYVGNVVGSLPPVKLSLSGVLGFWNAWKAYKNKKEDNRTEKIVCGILNGCFATAGVATYLSFKTSIIVAGIGVVMPHVGALICASLLLASVVTNFFRETVSVYRASRLVKETEAALASLNNELAAKPDPKHQQLLTIKIENLEKKLEVYKRKQADAKRKAFFTSCQLLGAISLIAGIFCPPLLLVGVGFYLAQPIDILQRYFKKPKPKVKETGVTLQPSAFRPGSTLLMGERMQTALKQLPNQQSKPTRQTEESDRSDIAEIPSSVGGRGFRVWQTPRPLSQSSPSSSSSSAATPPAIRRMSPSSVPAS